ncbi:MAG: hypothetical protein VYA34_10060 [Myxococcota bacterium]|nr:hypothetical protein [Myxococcota bacterium]
MPKFLKMTVGLSLAAVFVGCGDVGSIDAAETDFGLTMGLTEGSSEAVGMLHFLNAFSTDFEVLDDDAELDRRAAKNLIRHRNGRDNRHGSRDDNPFDSIAEVDDVRYVGRTALKKILKYARDHEFIPSEDDYYGTFDMVPFSAEEAEATLEVVNEVSWVVLRRTIRLHPYAVASIVGGRPVESLEEVADLYYVGKSAISKLKDFARPEMD